MTRSSSGSDHFLDSKRWSSQEHDAILTVDEVAANLRCSKAHVYNTINGKVPGISPLPVIGMGRRKLVRRNALEQWKRDNEHTAAVL